MAKPKCTHCKECLERFRGVDGLLYYYCYLCNQWYHVLVDKGLTELEEEPTIEYKKE